MSARWNEYVSEVDVVYILGDLFQNGPAPPCPDAADANDDGTLNIADPIAVLYTLFSPQTLIAPPYPEPGLDPTASDALGPCYY